MKAKRILSTLLAALLLAGSLTACAAGNEDDPQQTTSSEETETNLDDLPAGLNYNGTEIIILSRGRLGWYHDEIMVESLTSDPVNDAIYERTKAVESRLNVKITNLTDDDVAAETVPNKVATAVKAGTDEYQIMAAAAYTTAEASLTGIFANLNTTEYINLDREWWSQGYNRAMSFDGAQYTATGSMLISSYRLAFTTIFNKNLFTQANQPFLYDVVEEGKWTLDKQIALVPLFHRDNGNGQQDTSGDVYGFISNDYISVDPYWSACQMDFLGRTENGEYTLAMDTGRIHDVSEKVLHLYYNTAGAAYIAPGQTADREQEVMRGMFAEGFGAMATLRIMELESSVMRNSSQEYGVIPMPKYDEIQANYQTYLHDQFSVAAIPTTVKGDRLDMVSAVMEAMASASHRIVKPVYYEETLRTKIAQDPQSARMMDIVTQSIYIDAGLLYSGTFDYFHNSFRALISGKNNDATSRFKGVQKKSKKQIDVLNESLNKLASES
jgi:hypothetical protein